ncbi:dimethylallyl tryptophan synthase [Aspergillus ustus]|uniref:Prenyltransferase ucdE n=1 Tax=Aspergillus ustus TaxID=40382 RepID=UCDE_ASPUT|nr:dimethylallyl tryptophan synthase [Aspergillus ustus]
MDTQPQSNHPSVISAQLTPYDALDLAFTFEDRHQHEWWKRAGPVLGLTMRHARYDLNKQYQYLAFFARQIIPLLGPFPESAGSDYQRGFIPLEVSQNFQQSGTTVRLCFEPRTYSGYAIAKDPFGDLLVQEVVAKLGQVRGVKVDLQMFRQLASILNLTKDEEEELYQPACYENLPPTFKIQNIVGIQLPRSGNITLKADWFLSAKSLVSTIPITELSFEAIRTVDQGKNLFTPGLRPIEEYFRSMEMQPASPSHPRTTEFNAIACHLDDSTNARLKIYLSERLLKFDRVADIWTLGGRLKNCPGISQGLELVRALWSILQIKEGHHFPLAVNSLMMKGGDPASLAAAEKEDYPETQFFDEQFLVLNFEIRPGDPWPQPKIYFLLTELADNKVADAVVALFNRLGWVEEASRYKENLAAYYPHRDLDKTSGLQRFLSFSYSAKNGPYTSVYHWGIGG